MLKAQKDVYKVVIKENSNTCRSLPALTSIGEQVLTIGGFDSNIHYLRTVSSYQVKDNMWIEDLPQMNERRYGASACHLLKYVYVFAGREGRICLNSIEKIDVDSLVSFGKAVWKLIQVPQNILSTRTIPAVSQLNDTEIVIMGGLDGYQTYLGDLVVFNTKTSMCEQVGDHAAKYKFRADGN